MMRSDNCGTRKMEISASVKAVAVERLIPAQQWTRRGDCASQLRPKPMVEIGGHPILWHIMMMYWSHGFSDFIICLGYLGHVIKEYFANYVLHRSDILVDVGKNRIEYLGSSCKA